MNNIGNIIALAESNGIGNDAFISTVSNVPRQNKYSVGGHDLLDKDYKVLSNSQKQTLMNTTGANLGTKVDLDTLTQIRQKVISQSFFTINIADLIPLQVGYGAWMQSLLTYKEFDVADNFESGILDVGNNSKISEVDVGFEPKTVKILNWAKQVGYSIMDINQASRSGNWSLIEKKEAARKRNWDLGLQKTAFLGHSDDTAVKGLLNLTGVTNDTTTLAGKLSTLSDADFQTFVSKFIQKFSDNSKSTTLPDTFMIPLSDWLGLDVAVSSTYPNKTRRQYLIEAFRGATGNANAQVVPNAYCDAANNNLSATRYVLYKNDADTLQMDIPVDYTSAIAGTTNNFQFESVAYGQFTGVDLHREREVYYFSF